MTGRAERLYGAANIDRMFPDEAPTTTVPFPPAGRRKDKKTYDEGLVKTTLSTPPTNLQDVDPRTVRATQPGLTRSGVKHYMENSDWHETGRTYADHDNPGNRVPVVYDRDDGQSILLSGHHRAAAALLQGQQFKARRIAGPWGPPRRPPTSPPASS